MMMNVLNILTGYGDAYCNPSTLGGEPGRFQVQTQSKQFSNTARPRLKLKTKAGV